MIIGFAGKKQTGKTTSANFLQHNFAFDKYSFAQPIKDIACLLFGWDEITINNLKEQTCPVWKIKPREFLQWFGTDVMRVAITKRFPKFKSAGNFWVDKMKLEFDNYKRFLTIDDIRFQNELDAIHELGGIVINMQRDTNCDDPHVSENQELIGIDYEINNDSTIESLYTKLTKILETEQARLFELSEQN